MMKLWLEMYPTMLRSSLPPYPTGDFTSFQQPYNYYLIPSTNNVLLMMIWRSTLLHYARFEQLVAKFLHLTKQGCRQIIFETSQNRRRCLSVKGWSFDDGLIVFVVLFLFTQLVFFPYSLKEQIHGPIRS
mmetsp:Transcript_31943/g.75138  ORF Transcript_31943/g.75138 Transcript_31943/m.75138 type:complete len:130 (-) Transcript_31943:720-1109(-)